MQFNTNVYDAISNEGYICKGDKLYSSEEMSDMLSKSNLKLAHLGILYELNHDVAMEKVQELDNSFSRLPDDYGRVDEESECYDEIQRMNFIEIFFRIHLVIDIMLAVGLFVVHFVAEVPLSVFFLMLGIVGLSYAVSMIVTWGLNKVTQDYVDDFIERTIVDVNRREGQNLLNERKTRMYQILNTILMYDKIREKVEYGDEEEEEPDWNELDEFDPEDWVEKEDVDSDDDSDDSDDDDDGVVDQDNESDEEPEE